MGSVGQTAFYRPFLQPALVWGSFRLSSSHPFPPSSQARHPRLGPALMRCLRETQLAARAACRAAEDTQRSAAASTGGRGCLQLQGRGTSGTSHRRADVPCPQAFSPQPSARGKASAGGSATTAPQRLPAGLLVRLIRCLAAQLGGGHSPGFVACVRPSSVAGKEDANLLALVDMAVAAHGTALSAADRAQVRAGCTSACSSDACSISCLRAMQLQADRDAPALFPHRCWHHACGWAGKPGSAALPHAHVGKDRAAFCACLQWGWLERHRASAPAQRLFWTSSSPFPASVLQLPSSAASQARKSCRSSQPRTCKKRRSCSQPGQRRTVGALRTASQF